MRGGLAEAVSKMGFGNRLGMDFGERMTPEELLAPAIGSLVLEVPAAEDAGALFAGLEYRLLGETLPQGIIRVNGLELDVAELQSCWEKPLEEIFPTRVEKSPIVADPAYERPLFCERPRPRRGRSIARPRVLITVFPGTNNEYDAARAFTKAGGRSRCVRLPQPERRRHRGLHCRVGQKDRCLRRS